MGRIQDAMRRAAEEAEAQTVEKPAPAAGPFPDEPPAEEARPAAPSAAPPDADPAFTAEEVAEAEPAAGDEADDMDEMRVPDEGAPPVPGGTAAIAKRFNANLTAKVVVDNTMLASSREQYRRLAAALHHAKEATGVKVVLIASAVAGEGKSLTAANLALTFSESYQRSVLLIDGDLRKPSLHRMFKIDVKSGLTDALASADEPELAVYQVSDLLTILPAGKPNSDPMAGLTSGRMRRLLEEARESFEWVFIDTPPVGLLSDANLLSAMVDAAVLVIRADRTPYNLVERAVEALGADRILGTVLNQATATLHGYAYDYYRYYQAPHAQSAQGG